MLRVLRDLQQYALDLDTPASWRMAHRLLPVHRREPAMATWAIRNEATILLREPGAYAPTPGDLGVNRYMQYTLVRPTHGSWCAPPGSLDTRLPAIGWRLGSPMTELLHELAHATRYKESSAYVARPRWTIGETYFYEELLAESSAWAMAQALDHWGGGNAVGADASDTIRYLYGYAAQLPGRNPWDYLDEMSSVVQAVTRAVVGLSTEME